MTTTRPTDITFISPSNEKLGLFHRFVPRSIPLGIAILTSYLMEKGYSVEIVDEEIAKIDIDTLTNKMKTMAKPKIFGISTMTTNATRAYSVAKMIKTLDKEAVVVVGGIHPTVMPEEVLSTGYIDFVIRGEAERSLLLLLQKLKAGNKEYDDIENLVYKDSSGNFVYNQPESNPFDVNELPMFPYHIFDKKYYDLGFILTSRGCPFDCIFCSQKMITKRRYRAISNEVVANELDYLINKLDIKNITFFDDYFTGDKKRVFQLCKMIREKGLHKKCSFGAQTRGDSVDRELLIEMKKSGFDSLMFGFETSSNHLMDIINKQETVEDNINAIKLAREVGFTTEATFIFGFPEEKYEDRIKALQIAKDIVDRARFNNATPYPGTKLYEIAVKENRLNMKDGWSNFSSAGAVTANIFEKYKAPYSPEGTRPEDLVGEVFLANLLFYLNISNLKKLFNIKKSGSGKWFEIPKKQLLNPFVWLGILLLAVNVFLRAIYFFLFSKECRRFALDGFLK
jgi:radical SAM superfamily enzyme YgiQ (UPF0313 family)